MHDAASHLVKMANQIGQFFESQSPGDPGAAAQAVAGHLKLFWAPTMRSQFVQAVDDGSAAGLTDVSALAVRNHRDALLNQQTHVAAEQQETFPKGGGDAG